MMRLLRSGVTRRSLLRAGAAGAVGLSAGAGTWAVSAAAARAAAPAGVGTRVHLTVSVAYQGAGVFQGVNQEIVDRYIAENWLPSHRGVEVTTIGGMGCNGVCMTASQQIAASLAGTPADVVTGCCSQFPEYLAADLLLPLDPYLRQDNVDLSEFAPGHLAGLHTASGQMALPEYDDPNVVLVNEGMLDELGLAYPKPDWTYEEATSLWRSASGLRQGKQINGMGLNLLGYDENDVPNWLVHAFGGEKSNAAGTRSLVDSPQVVEAVKWAVPLVWDKVATTSVDSSAVQTGTVAMAMSGGGDVQNSAVLLRSFKWNYYPMPVFPTGQPATFINNDFYGINQYTRNAKELVWEMFKFLTMDPGFAKLQFRLTFITPNQKSLWGDWMDVVRATAPDLRNVDLETKVQAVQYGWASHFMRYAPLQAKALESAIWEKVVAHEMGASAGLAQIVKQVDAFEATGPTVEAQSQGQIRAFEQSVKKAEAAKTPVTFAAPPRVGPGVAATAATKLVTVNQAKGLYSLTGDGGGGVAGRADNCVLACAAYDRSVGSFVARLVSVSALGGAAIASGAKIGVMARASLGNAAASVGLEFALDRGVHFHVRPTDGASLADSRPASATTSTGLLGQSVVQAKTVPAGGNFLARPLWLRLDLHIDSWTPYTSLDGHTWSVAAPAAPVDFVGAWVGLFATSHTSGKRLTAVFDHVSGFQPDVFVQIGTA